jgi:hypothetical protein
MLWVSRIISPKTSKHANKGLFNFHRDLHGADRYEVGTDARSLELRLRNSRTSFLILFMSSIITPIDLYNMLLPEQ